MMKKKYQKKHTIGPNKARMLIWAIDMVKVGGRHMVVGTEVADISDGKKKKKKYHRPKRRQNASFGPLK